MFIAPTQTEAATIDKAIKTWTEITLSTEPADKIRAEYAVRKMYKLLGFPAPLIVWTKSPFANSICRALINSIAQTCLSGKRISYKLVNFDSCLDDPWGKKFRYTENQYQKSYLNRLSESLNGFVRQEAESHAPANGAEPYFFYSDVHALDKDEKSAMRSVMEHAKTTVWTHLKKTNQEDGDERQNSTSHIITETLFESVAWAKVWAGVDQNKSEGGQGRAGFAAIFPTESTFWDHQWSNHVWKTWMGFDRVGAGNSFGLSEGRHMLIYSILDAVGGLIEYDPLKAFSEVCKSAGQIIPCENICFISERHNIINFDDMGFLHCEDGPALAYPDGYKAYLWHGTPYPADWASNKPDASTALQWGNLEQRRVACEMVGWDKIIDELDVEIIDRDDDPEIGELVKVMIPRVGAELFLRVTCGTGRQFALPVPPDMQNARQANAWTWGLEAEQYKPEVRT